jgi:hypothetical protein
MLGSSLNLTIIKELFAEEDPISAERRYPLLELKIKKGETTTKTNAKTDDAIINVFFLAKNIWLIFSLKLYSIN